MSRERKESEKKKGSSSIVEVDIKFEQYRVERTMFISYFRIIDKQRIGRRRYLKVFNLFDSITSFVF